MCRNSAVTETLPSVKRVTLDVQDEKKEKKGNKEELVDRVYELDVKDKL